MPNQTRPLKILQICRLSPLWGIDLFKQISLAYEEHQVTTVFLSGKSAPELLRKYHGKVIFFEINHKNPGWRFKAAWKLWKLCRKNAFDMAICHHYKPTVIMDWVSYFCKIKQLFSVHHTMGNLRRAGRRLYTRLSLKRKWQFIAVSDSVKHNLVNARAGISAQQVKTVYNAIMLEEVLDKQLSRQAAREKLGIKSNQFVFGTIGRLVSSKGQLSLIKAFANIQQQLPHSLLIILGEGPLEATLQNCIENLGVSEKIIIDSTNAKYAGSLIKAFDSFVFPSIEEGFGLVLLEAMSAKLPIIASNNGGIPEVVGKSGLMVSPQIKELSQALIKLYMSSEEELLQMGIAGYERLCQKFLQSHFKAALTQLLLI